HGIVNGPAVGGGRGRGSLGRAVAIQPNGRIVVVGKATSSDGSGRDGLLVERYRANGGLDRSFGSGGVVNLFADSFGDGYAVALEPSGAIVAAGSDDATGSGGTAPRVALARLSASGHPDGSFGSHGLDVIDLGAYSYALGVAVARGGKLVIAGSQSPGLQATNALVGRLTPSGRLDHSFRGSGYYAHQYARQAAFSAFNAVAVRGNGQIVTAGTATSSGLTGYAIVARFRGSGAPDGSFGSGGVAYARSAVDYLTNGTSFPGANGLTVLPNGEVIAAGRFNTSVESKLALWAFTAGGRPAGGFGSHGSSVLTLHNSPNSEGAAIAQAGTSAVVVAGDEDQLGKPFGGLIARYGAR
ncbi:MAG TPA: hypothetical protein VG223_06635, partial [Solirubrobacteraceae bacterium]|nr:hypothetical protein [Solirubrobacteraceae bacterium]